MQPQRDLAQNTLGVLFIGGLIAATFWVLRPFIPAVIWAVTVVVATWPLMRKVEARLWGKRGLAVTVMTLALLAMLVVPLFVAIVTIADNEERIVGWVKWLMAAKLPPPPDWVAGLPLVGAKLQALWLEHVSAGVQDVAGRLAPYADRVGRWFVAEAGTVGMTFVQLLLIVILSSLMYAGGEAAAAWLRLFGRRLAGQRGENMVVLAGQAIRGVAMGVVVTALVQSLFGGIGLAIAGVPMAGVLTALMLLLCIAQLGPALVLIPAVVWLFWSGEQGWGIFLAVWSLIALAMDNVLRPVLIRRGADLPLLLIFAGVIGGLITFGLVGIFVGPVILAVTYTLLDEWVAGNVSGGAEPSGGEPARFRIPGRRAARLPRSRP
jgi:predicted PurR-regulated permease PerM